MEANAVKVVRRVFPRLEKWDQVECIWRRSWRDKYGNFEMRPFRTSCMTREEFDKVKWENLAPGEQAALLEWQSHAYRGWTPRSPN